MFSVDSEASGEGKTIGDQLAVNLKMLEQGLWSEVLKMAQCSATCGAPVAGALDGRFLANHIVGLGPKTKPELLQAIGLTRFEIPIDSRLIKWLNEFGFPVRLSASALSDPIIIASSLKAFSNCVRQQTCFRVFSMLQSSPVSIRVAGTKTISRTGVSGLSTDSAGTQTGAC